MLLSRLRMMKWLSGMSHALISAVRRVKGDFWICMSIIKLTSTPSLAFPKMRRQKSIRSMSALLLTLFRSHGSTEQAEATGDTILLVCLRQCNRPSHLAACTVKTRAIFAHHQHEGDCICMSSAGYSIFSTLTAPLMRL